VKLLSILALALPLCSEPLLVFPIGAPTDQPFTDQQLLDISVEFPQDGFETAYFGNPEDTVLCLSNGQCSTLAESWSADWQPVVSEGTWPVPCVPVESAVPEPTDAAILLCLLLAVGLLAAPIWKIKRER
jgi:hypothetical protein